jgi:predicted ATPase/DNA-binding XRE family transcriptional regulator
MLPASSRAIWRYLSRPGVQTGVGMTSVQELVFGGLLRRHRRSAGLTQEELAERANVSVRAISDLERGVKHRPHKETVQLLADALALAGDEREDFKSTARHIAQPNGSSSRAAPRTPSNLRDVHPPFIGRGREIAEITELVQASKGRLVTLTGTGGTGKTRLALQVAGQLLHDFQDGIYFVSLASIGDPVLVPSAIAEVLGVKTRESQAHVDTVTEYLKDRHLLLVLDNFEHLLDASQIVTALLDACPRLSILVTSRFLLHLSREQEYPVLPLSLPELKHLPPIEALSRYDAVALFLRQAQAARPGFALTEGNAQAVAEICVHLDGLPLAIELAAIRIRVFPPQALLGRLSNRLQILSGGARDLHPRQQTLRATIDWSYDLLSGAEQMLLARLSVFAGGCTLEGADAVCNPERKVQFDAPDEIGGLIEKSLLRQEESVEGELRFVMLETIREYARERLGHSGEEKQIREAHAQYFFGLVRATVPTLGGSRMGVSLERLENDKDNLRAALGWLRDGGKSITGLEFTTALGYWWIGRGHLAEGLHWFRTFLNADSESTTVRWTALNDASFLALLHGDHEEARRFAEESLRIARATGNPQQIGRALGNLPRIMLVTGDIDRILELTQEGIEIARRTGEKDLLAFHFLSRAEGMRIAGNYEEARRLYQESLVLYRELGASEMVATDLHNLIEVELDEENLDEATELLRDKVAIALQIRHMWIDCYTILSFARLAGARGHLVVAARLLAASTQMFQSTGVSIDTIERIGYESTLSLLRERLEADELAFLWKEGQAMNSEDALAYAIEQNL